MCRCEPCQPWKSQPSEFNRVMEIKQWNLTARAYFFNVTCSHSTWKRNLYSIHRFLCFYLSYVGSLLTSMKIFLHTFLIKYSCFTFRYGKSVMQLLASFIRRPLEALKNEKKCTEFYSLRNLQQSRNPKMP